VHSRARDRVKVARSKLRLITTRVLPLSPAVNRQPLNGQSIDRRHWWPARSDGNTMLSVNRFLESELRSRVYWIARHVASILTRSLTAGLKQRNQENEEKRKRKEGNLCNLGKNNAYSRTMNDEAALQPWWLVWRFYNLSRLFVTTDQRWSA